MTEPEVKVESGDIADADVEEIIMTEGAQKLQDDAVNAPTEFPASKIAQGLMQNPEVLAALQDKLGGMIGLNSGYIQTLPKVVKRRLKALKKLQFESIKIESKFYEEIHELECRYADKYSSLFDRRKEIVGGLEPTDSDCDWPSDEEDDDEIKLSTDMQAKVTIDAEGKSTEEKEGEKKEEDDDEERPEGIPEFWLTIFKNVDMLAEMVQDADEPILSALKDIKLKFSQKDPMGFTLEFIFGPNEYFTNTVLTKEYIMRSEPDPEDALSFEGPEIIRCNGCKIDWKKGKNVTVKLVKKTQKHASRGTRRTVTKTVQNDSFFNFFNPPAIDENEEPDEETEALLAADFELGHFIRERIVPRAVLYFTGEALEDDDYDDEEEEGEDDDDDEDEENDADFVP